MKKFNELGVKLTRRFQGDRIRIEKIDGDEVIVKDFEIKQSKLKNENENEERNECLYLQIEVKGENRVLWGNYKYLIDQIRQISKGDLPFKATIINDHGYIFK